MTNKGILLGALALVAGCSGVPAANEQAVANEVIANDTYVSPNLAGSWDKLFGEPKASIDSFSRIGLRPGPYEKKGGEWRSDATPTPLTDPAGKDVVVANFAASGTETAITKVEFSLTEPQMSNDQQARDAFDKWVSQALSQLGVTGGDTAVKAIHGDKRMTGSLKGGADYVVARTTTAKERLLTVTFTPTETISDGKTSGTA